MNDIIGPLKHIASQEGPELRVVNDRGTDLQCDIRGLVRDTLTEIERLTAEVSVIQNARRSGVKEVDRLNNWLEAIREECHGMACSFAAKALEGREFVSGSPTPKPLTINRYCGRCDLFFEVAPGQIVACGTSIDGKDIHICPACDDSRQTDTRDYKALYFELIYEVANKYPGETRHETAKRYITERETPDPSACDSAEKGQCST